MGGCTDLLAMMLGEEPASFDADLRRVAISVMPRGFTAYVSKPEIPTYFVGRPEVVARFHELVPSPNDTYCNLFWPLDTGAADKLIKEHKAKDAAARRVRSSGFRGR